MTDRDPSPSTAPSIREKYGRLVSYSLPSPGVTPQAFLRAADLQPRFFWENVSDGVSLAGAGTAVELMAWGPDRFDHIQRQAMDLFDGVALLNAKRSPVVPRLFGGSAFCDEFEPNEAWAGFTPARAANAWQHVNASLKPCSPVPALAFPVLISR